MKLFYKPGACSLAPHITLHELKVPFEAELVDLKTKRLASGGDYLKVNPKGSVPALQLDNGEVLTEAGVVLLYLADQKPDAKLAPPSGTFERYRIQEWLNYLATEVHKGFSPLFKADTPEVYKPVIAERLANAFGYLATRLEGKQFVMDEAFTVADPYLFTLLTWRGKANLELARWPSLQSYFDRVKERPSVQAALEAERKAKAA
jgi:glutathione S-transferase